MITRPSNEVLINHKGAFMVIIVDAEECTGCRVCELICSLTKQKEFNPAKSHIRVMNHDDFGVYIPVLKTECDFCGKCVELCPVQALKMVEPGEAAIMRRKSRIGSFPIPIVR
jgi:Fe-S-cluster-containing hydrogenase component 2